MNKTNSRKAAKNAKNINTWNSELQIFGPLGLCATLSLKAFTITETLVAMVIAGLMITMAAFSWGAFGKQFQNYQSGNEQLQQIEKLHSILTLDIERCVWMKKTSQGIELEMRNGTAVSFVFEEKISRLIDAHTEKFDLKTEDWKGIYGKNESTPDQPYIDQLNLSLIQNKIVYPFYFFKQYDALQKMNFED